MYVPIGSVLIRRTRMDQDLTVILHGKPNEVSSSLFHMNRHVFDVNL